MLLDSTRSDIERVLSQSDNLISSQNLLKIVENKKC